MINYTITHLFKEKPKISISVSNFHLFLLLNEKYNIDSQLTVHKFIYERNTFSIRCPQIHDRWHLSIQEFDISSEHGIFKSADKVSATCITHYTSFERQFKQH